MNHRTSAVPLSLRASHPTQYANVCEAASALAGDPDAQRIMQSMVHSLRPDLMPAPVRTEPDDPKPDTQGAWSLEACSFTPRSDLSPPTRSPRPIPLPGLEPAMRVRAVVEVEAPAPMPAPIRAEWRSRPHSVISSRVTRNYTPTYTPTANPWAEESTRRSA